MRRFALGCVIALVAAGSAAADPFLVRFDTLGLGSFTVELHDNTPLHRDNFLAYVTAGLYDSTIIHRSDDSNHVIQGGAVAVASDPDYLLEYVPTFPNVLYEGDLGDSNVMMTLGAARSTDPDSANSQWYLNMGDNSGGFDHQPGVPGYTVFGHVVEGWDTAVAIYGLTVWDASMYFSTDGVTPNNTFLDLPLMDSFDNTGPIEKPDFVTVSGTTIVPEPATLALLATGALALLRRRNR